MTLNRRFRAEVPVGILLLVLGGPGLTWSCQDDGRFQPYGEVAASTKTMQIGGQEIILELALTESERQRGLMHRKLMPEHHGMLFVFREAKLQRFWNKNVFIPLSIAFIAADGTIVNIVDLPPHQEHPGALSEDKVKYVLELNQGEFARLGVGAGDKLELPDWVADLVVES